MGYRLTGQQLVPGGLNESTLAQIEALAQLDGERDLKTNRTTQIDSWLKNGEFNRCDWAKVHCLENGVVYRANGQHSSVSLRKILNGKLDAKFPYGIPVSMSEYECDGIDDLPDVFKQFDRHESVRSAEDMLGIYISQHKDLAGIDKKFINSILAGVVFARRTGTKAAEMTGDVVISSAHDRGKLLGFDSVRQFICDVYDLKDAEFHKWYSKSGSVGAMFEQYLENQEMADLFFQRMCYEVDENAKRYTANIRKANARTGKDSGWYWRETFKTFRNWEKELANPKSKEMLKNLIREVLEESDELCELAS